MDTDGSTSMEGVETSYKLSRELVGHEADVRSVCFLRDRNAIVTSSRDKSIRVWQENPDTKQWDTVHILLGHQHFVSVVCPVPYGSSVIEKGGLASGGNDNIINIWDLEQPSEPFRTLVGHEKPVVALATTPEGDLVSGSWDHTARVWRGSECIQELKGHTQAVWAVAYAPGFGILTGSADMEIKLWKDGQCVHTYKGHTEYVRALQIVEGVGFLSSDNGGVIKLWSFSGECLRDMHGHSSFIFSLAVCPNGDIASAGEDRTLKIWSDGECKQTVMHPSTVWCVAAMPNGDIVTACSDSVARIWSKIPERYGDELKLAEYDARLASVAIPTNSAAIGDLNTERLPGAEALEVPGEKDGQTLMIKQGGLVEVYQWSAADTQWVKIGQVVDAVGDSNKKAIDGKEYDFVFDVDLGDGMNRKLPYNVTDNPYSTAQEFILREELSQDFLDQIAKFIIDNTKGFTLGAPETGFVDPYTGGTRYVPGSGDISNSAGVDPFTGAGRYVPSYSQPQPTQPQQPSPQIDPTIFNRFGPRPISEEFKHFPNKVNIYFEAATFDAIAKKLLEFNDEISKDESIKAIALSPEEQEQFKSTVAILKETSRYHATTFAASQLKAITKVIEWPEKYKFPALDILRLMLLHPDAAKYFGNSYQAGSYDLIGTVVLDSIKDSSPAPNQIMGLRTLVNMFNVEATRAVVGAKAESILEAAADCASSSNKNVRTALITLILNYSVYFQKTKNPEAKIQCMSMLSEVLGSEQDPELVYRALVALGTLIYDDAATKGLVGDLDIRPNIEKFASASETKLKEVANELLNYLSGNF